jgi:hypothetical protein
MQLSVRTTPDERWATEVGNKNETPHQAMMREYEARRCHICQCKYPSFGFGSPLKAGGPTIWSCLVHRGEVDQIARGVGAAPAQPQARLL